MQPANLVETIARLLAATDGARALIVQDCDTRRSETHVRGITQCIELAAQHPALECVANEHRYVSIPGDEGHGEDIAAGMVTSVRNENGMERGGARGDVVMHAYRSRQRARWDEGALEK